MSRKDFQLIADVIRLLPSFECSQAGDVVRHSAIVARFAEPLARTIHVSMQSGLQMYAMGSGFGSCVWIERAVWRVNVSTALTDTVRRTLPAEPILSGEKP